MALRSPALWMGNPAVQHTAQNDRLMLAGLHRPDPASTAANRPLTALPGVIAGPPGTMGEVTLLSNTQFTVNPARWVLYSSASALGGSYKVVNDAVETIGITAQNASQYRRSYFGVWVIDSFVAGAGDDLPHWGVVDGALAASAGVAALPSAGSLPANFLALGEFLIPPVGQAVTYTPYDVRTGLRGGVLPVTATDARLPAYDGQVRWHPTFGIQAGRSGGWQTAGLTSMTWVRGVSVAQQAAAVAPKLWVASLDAVYGGNSYSVIIVTFVGVSFTEAPTVVVTPAGENTYSLFGGIDNLTTTGCYVILRSGVNIPGTIVAGAHIVAFGR